MVLVHHRPLEQQGDIRGMGNYLLYMTKDACPNTQATASLGSAEEHK